jgi:acetyltransferase-like isoleucine patch superfamily enzyme
MLGRDAGIAFRNFYLNGVAGSFLVPAVVRKFLYRAAGMRVDSRLVSPHCRIDGSPRNIGIGASTYVNVGCYFEGVGAIAVGKDCALGMQVMVITSDHPRLQGGGWNPDAKGKAVIVGDRVWIGARATILPGVTVGDDVIIAAGAIVTRDCAAEGMYAGAPARRIRDIGARSVVT